MDLQRSGLTPDKQGTLNGALKWASITADPLQFFWRAQQEGDGR
jgi:hypothetical protein